MLIALCRSKQDEHVLVSTQIYIMLMQMFCALVYSAQRWQSDDTWRRAQNPT